MSDLRIFVYNTCSFFEPEPQRRFENLKTSDNRKVALLVLAAISLSFIGLASPVAGAQTLDITGLRISPNPGYACENTTISFNVTNNLGTMVDMATVSVAAKSSVGGMSWQSNITLFADGATSFQSFTWTYPAEGTYDVSITVFGAGQIAQKSGVYTVLPCKAHVYIGTVTIVKSVQAPGDSATVMVDVMNDGHAPAYNTTVAVQAMGPYPETTRYFIGSTVVPVVDVGAIGRVDIFWQTLPAAGVYNVSAMAIDDNGVIADIKNNVTTVQSQPVQMNSVRIVNIAVDPYPPMQGQESNVTVDLMFQGNWSGVPVTVKAYADGPSSYSLLNITLKNVMVQSLVPVNFSWPAAIEPGEYNLTVTAMFNPKEYTISKLAVTQMAKQKAWLPSNFRLELKGMRISPYPALPGQNSTVTVEIANTGDADAPPAKLTVTAEGPAFYNLGTRTTPSLSFGSMVRMDFPWTRIELNLTQPIVPGEYTIRAFLEDAGGNQSELRKTYPMPHILESNMSIVNGTAVYNYYYFGAAPNGSQGQNITVVVPATLNETEAATGLNNPAVAGAAGVAVGGVISIVSVLAYAYAKHKGQMGNVQSNPMYKENANQGQNPMYQDKGMAGENPLYIHERMVHGLHAGEGVAEPPEASLVGGALPGGAVISSAVSSDIRESLTLPSTGPTSDAKSKVAAVGRVETPLGLQGTRESPTLASTGVVAPRDSASGLATGRRQYVPHGVTDADGGASSDARMAINEKGLPGKKKPSAQRLAGNGIEPVDPDDDGDSVPDIQGMAINEKGLPGDKKPKKTSSQARTGGGGPWDEDADDDVLPTVDERKGWDGTIKGVTSDAGATGREAAHPVISNVRESPTKASGLRESPTRASNASTRDSVSSVAQTAGSGGDGMPTESLDQSRKGWDGTIKGVTTDESALGREAAHPVISKLRESPTRASGLRESPTLPSTGQTAVRESPTKASTGQTAIRESPTLPSRDQASGQASGIAIDESGTQVVHARDVATGQASGLRESPTKASTGQTSLRESPTLPSKGQTSIRESPAGSSDFGINEQGIKAPESGPGDAAQIAKDEAGKKDFKGHVTLLK
jgi:hypothetical protein